MREENETRKMRMGIKNRGGIKKEEAAEETDEECALDLLRCRHSSDSWSQCEDSGGAGGQQVSAQEGAGCLTSLP